MIEEGSRHESQGGWEKVRQLEKEQNFHFWSNNNTIDYTLPHLMFSGFLECNKFVFLWKS